MPAHTSKLKITPFLIIKFVLLAANSIYIFLTFLISYIFHPFAGFVPQLRIEALIPTLFTILVLGPITAIITFKLLRAPTPTRAIFHLLFFEIFSIVGLIIFLISSSKWSYVLFGVSILLIFIHPRPKK